MCVCGGVYVKSVTILVCFIFLFKVTTDNVVFFIKFLNTVVKFFNHCFAAYYDSSRVVLLDLQTPLNFIDCSGSFDLHEINHTLLPPHTGPLFSQELTNLSRQHTTSYCSLLVQTVCALNALFRDKSERNII